MCDLIITTIYCNTNIVYKTRDVIGGVRCDFLQIYAPTSYGAVFLLHTLAPASIKIGFGVVRFGAVWTCGLG